MSVKWHRAVVIALASAALLAGCASSPMESKEELRTSSDQSEDQKRARIRLQLAIGYYEQRQINVALDEIKRALQADPNLADAYSVRGLIYMEMGENRLAEDNFLQSIKLDPSNPDLTNNYGWFLCQTGRERQAMSYFESALNNRTYQSPAKALNNAGVCSLKVKDLNAAEKYFIRAFQFEPGNPLTNAHLAKLHYDKKDYERARFYIGRVMKSDIMTADILWLAIKTERKLGDRAAEASLATQLRRRHPNSVEYAAFQRGAFDE
jgi:type IV pilus assembly protein PilF